MKNVNIYLKIRKDIRQGRKKNEIEEYTNFSIIKYYITSYLRKTITQPCSIQS